MENMKDSQESTAKQFGMHRSQISRIMKQKEKPLQD